jgi:integrase/recombinase XerD
VSTYLKIKENLKECETQRSFALFFNAINSEKSKKTYIYDLNKFIEFAKLETYDKLASLDSETIQNHLEQFVFHCKKKGHKNNGIKTRIAAPELFLDMNRKIYYKKILHRLLPRDDVPIAGNVPFSNDDIGLMLDFTNKFRTKAVVHILASTGIRPGALSDPPLRMKHIVDMPNGCKRIKLYDESREGYWGFLTPEASKAFQRYVNMRKRNGEDINEESYALITYNFQTKKIDYLNDEDLSAMLKNLIKNSKIIRKKVGKHYDKAQTYGFRKRFNGILKLDNQINSNIAEKLMGIQ